MLNKVVRALEQEKQNFAHSALKSPATDMFLHGKNVGYYAGLQKALDIINNLYRDDEETKRDI
ncbi:hypothetical protein UFOVP868_17 [uncultured Caudovirales phage]|uniref:Uncharacterized protein n=1 Tax=uncultured Caudovirales phage TaxID=2100421 RepID=A0A6J5PE88_9CAUD|nr:hypothetical protein UFOVP868_17 [uncultured Caudovirales phage]